MDIKMDMKKLLAKYGEGLDEGIEIPESWSWIKSGKIGVRIIFEDGSYKDYYVKLKSDYAFNIKNKSYLIMPKAILLGKRPFFTYWYNNPFPIDLSYRSVAKGVTDTLVDGRALKVSFDSNLINKMYSEPKFFTTKNVIILIIVVLVVVLILLQVTGTVDVMGFFVNKRGG